MEQPPQKRNVAYLGPPEEPPLLCRLDILVMAEQVRRIVLVLHSYKPLVIRPVGGLDALRALVGLQADLVDVVAAPW
jgi:hypothetical protein